MRLRDLAKLFRTPFAVLTSAGSGKIEGVTLGASEVLGRGPSGGIAAIPFATIAGAAPGVAAVQLFDLVRPGVYDPEGVAASTAASAFTGHDHPGPFTDPDVPRNVLVTYEVGWASPGPLTVHGTDQYDEDISEEFPFSPGALVTGEKCFKTVTGATCAGNGAGGGGVKIGLGAKIGFVPSGTPGAVAIILAEFENAGSTGHAAVDTTNHTIDLYSCPAVDLITGNTDQIYALVSVTPGA